MATRPVLRPAKFLIAGTTLVVCKGPLATMCMIVSELSLRTHRHNSVLFTGLCGITFLWLTIPATRILGHHCWVEKCL